MSPSPARSTLITSAPSHARSCVQVGPDCTCVKSRMRTPSSALLINYPHAMRSSRKCFFGPRRQGFFLAAGLRLVMRPLSVPAFSSITALISVGGRDREAHADAHDAPRADVQALARLVHVHDAAGEVQRVRALVDDDGVRVG